MIRSLFRKKPENQSFSPRRRRLAFALAISLFAFLPIAIFQVALYRSNLAVAAENRPLTPPIQKTERLLVIAPHCDDETLGAGGVMAAAREAGARVQVVFITNGDGSGSTELVARARELQNKVSGGDEAGGDKSQNLFQRIAAMRRREALAACAVLGIAEKDVIFLGYPDGGTQAMWQKNWTAQNAFVSPYTKTSRSPYDFSFTRNAPYCGAQVTDDLQKIIKKFQPTVVMTTHPADTHPDHWAAYGYAAAALERLRLDGDASTRGMARRAKLLAFLIHHGIWPAPHGYHPDAALAPPASLENSGTRWTTLPLADATREQKKSALGKYTSQLVFTPHYLRAFVRRNELFGQIPVASNPKSTTQNLKLLKDAPSDSSWRDAWPAADIETLSCEIAPRVLTVQVQLADAPSPRAHYRFALHAVSTRGVAAWTVEARRSGSGLQATLISRGENQESENPENNQLQLGGALTPNGFIFDLPRETLGVLGGPSSLLFSGATFAGNTRLDQTETAILRLEDAS